MAGVDELIPAQVIAELAKSATLRPLAFLAAAEPRDTPFWRNWPIIVRCRRSDLPGPGM